MNHKINILTNGKDFCGVLDSLRESIPLSVRGMVPVALDVHQQTITLQLWTQSGVRQALASPSDSIQTLSEESTP